MPVRWNASFRGVAVASLLALLGCGKTPPPEFRLDMTKMVANQIVPKHQQAIADILDGMFGTPDKPYALPETGLDVRKLKMAAGPVWSDSIGGKHGLYRRHCAFCHGISGDGHGPTAMIVNPYPRDYRSGVFKFKSTYNPNQPTDEDLYAILHNGIPTTAMPSFSVLPPDEVEALVEYVKYLSMRGQMETSLVNYITQELDFDPAKPEEASPLDPVQDEEQRGVILGLLTDEVVAGWQEAAEGVIVPADGALPHMDRAPDELANSVKLGRELFYGTKANCIKCHGPTGLGDGQQDDYDNWNKANKKFLDDTAMLQGSIKTLKASKAELSGDELASANAELQLKYRELKERNDLIVHMLPPRNAIPRNLREGMFRGGRRPLDLYRRVNQGIAGTPMPAGGPAAPGAQGTLTDEEIWHIVDYVRSLPFEPASRPMTRPINPNTLVN